DPHRDFTAQIAVNEIFALYADVVAARHVVQQADAGEGSPAGTNPLRNLVDAYLAVSQAVEEFCREYPDYPGLIIGARALDPLDDAALLDRQPQALGAEGDLHAEDWALVIAKLKQAAVAAPELAELIETAEQDLWPRPVIMTSVDGPVRTDLHVLSAQFT